MKKQFLLKTMFLLCALVVGSSSVWADQAVLPGTQALTTSFANVGNDENIQIKISTSNSYTSPIRIYANNTVTIKANNNKIIQSVIYEASSTGNYVTYAQNATVSPSVTPTVDGKKVTWTYSESDNVTEFTFKPGTQTRANSITINYTSAGPSAKLSKTSLSFGEVEVGQTKQMTFTVTPSNLTGALTIASNNPKYLVSPESIAQDASGAQTITVTAAPTSLNDDMDGTITISGGGLTNDGTVSLSATPYQNATITLVATDGKGTFEKGGTTITSLTSRVGNTETIKAVPVAFYDFSSWTAIGATPATSTDAETEFTITSPDVTLTANFTEKPTYNLSSAISPTDDAGTVVFDVTTLHEGESTTATATANAGYKFTGWSISGAGATLTSTTDNPTSVTMGTADATITANFEAVTTYPIHWSVNGTIVKTDNVEENTAVTFPTTIDGIPAGYVLKGWVVEANKIDTPTDTDPKANYVTETNSTAEITYYAVMAIEKGISGSGLLTGDEIASNFASSGMSYSDNEKTYTDSGDGITWGARCSTNTNRHWIQLKNDANVYIKVAAPEDITQVKLKISNASNESGGIDDISKHGSFSGNVKLDNVQTTNTGTYGSAASSAISNNILTIEPTKAANTLYIHVDAAARIWNVEISYGNKTVSNFCTTVSSVPKAITVDAKGYSTLCSDLPLDFSNAVSKAYKAKVEDNAVKMTQVTKVPAGEGILIKGEAEDIPVLTGDADDFSDNELIGVLVNTTVTANTVSVLSTVNDVEGFYKFGGTTIPAGKAYLNTVASDGVRGMTIVFEEEGGTTGIASAAKPQRTMKREAYNLNGQRVAQPTKGLYIVNGRKVVIK